MGTRDNANPAAKSPEEWLAKVDPEKTRGTFKLFLGYAPGVGKTYNMLSEAIRRYQRGEDIVIGVVETHGRPRTAELAEQLEKIPRRQIEYKGVHFEEMDLDGILARKPQIVLIDELAHTNIEGSRHRKRYEDVLDVLAANPLMTALSPMYTPGRNILRAAFLDSAVSDLFCDPDLRLENVVSALRASVGPDADDPQLTALIGELSLKSSDFRRLWARHDVKPHVGSGVHRMQHPQVGELELRYDKFHLAGADRQMLTIYQAQPGSRSEQALTLLATVAAEQQHPSGRTSEPG